MRARQIMTRTAVTVTPETSILEQRPARLSLDYFPAQNSKAFGRV
jgi:hypothetical protein